METGWLYTIVPQVWEDNKLLRIKVIRHMDILFVVVRETAENEYRILLLNSAWDFSFDESSVFMFDDDNRNGTPEIALYIGAHSAQCVD